MAWIEPKINWTPNDYCTASDINRINGNVQYLLTHGEPSKVYTQNDIVTLTEFNGIINNLVNLARIVGISYPTIESVLTATTFNSIETLTANLKNPIDRRFNMSKANKYAGTYYTGMIRTGGK